MGTQERRERERQGLRHALLTATLDLAAEQGWPAVTVRKVAERIEYSPSMLYEHFDRKEALLSALLQEGYRRLRVEMEAAVAAAAGAEARLPALGRTYWHFALTNPALYQAMHGLDGVPFTAVENPEIQRIERLTGDAIIDLTGDLPAAELIDLIDLLWATLHGMVSLVLAQQLPGGAERGYRLIERYLADLIAGLRVRRSSSAQ